jgi:tetratricopeptide (TPR) repeat protein
LNNIKECVKDINTILSFDPNNEFAIILLAKVLKNQGKEKESETLMWKAYKINPENNETKQFTLVMKTKMDEILKKANVNILKGRLKTGLLLTTQALKIFPNHPEALLLRSTIYKSLGLLKESITDLSLAVNKCSKLLQDNIMEEAKKRVEESNNFASDADVQAPIDEPVEGIEEADAVLLEEVVYEEAEVVEFEETLVDEEIKDYELPEEVEKIVEDVEAGLVDAADALEQIEDELVEVEK